jgi:hypothetical protein
MLSEIWRAIIAFLVWLSADPAAVDLEAPRAAAAVAAALASMTPEAPPPPGPTPVACDCGQTCVRGIWKPDGRVQQKCPCSCKRCVAERAKGCPDGNCPLPQNVLR